MKNSNSTPTDEAPPLVDMPASPKRDWSRSRAADRLVADRPRQLGVSPAQAKPGRFLPQAVAAALTKGFKQEEASLAAWDADVACGRVVATGRDFLPGGAGSIFGTRGDAGVEGGARRQQREVKRRGERRGARGDAAASLGAQQEGPAKPCGTVPLPATRRPGPCEAASGCDFVSSSFPPRSASDEGWDSIRSYWREWAPGSTAAPAEMLRCGGGASYAGTRFLQDYACLQASPCTGDGFVSVVKRWEWRERERAREGDREGEKERERETKREREGER